jgi:hypothetical protein
MAAGKNVLLMAWQLLSQQLTTSRAAIQQATSWSSLLCHRILVVSEKEMQIEINEYVTVP